jgi:hypothetical protein
MANGQSRPLLGIAGDGSPEPPTACGHCGRRFDGLVRVYIGVDPDDI